MASSVKVFIYKQNGQRLYSVMSFYAINNKINDSSVQAISEDETQYIPQFLAISRDNNNCLISLEPHPITGKTHGVLRVRGKDKNDRYISTYGSVSETCKSGEECNNVLTAVRGVKEELGCEISGDFFKDHGKSGKFQFYTLVVDDEAADKLVTNYKRLVPFTEIYDLTWGNPGRDDPRPVLESASLKIVKVSDITDNPILLKIENALKSELPITLPANIRITRTSKEWANAPHNVAERTLESQIVSSSTSYSPGAGDSAPSSNAANSGAASASTTSLGRVVIASTSASSETSEFRIPTASETRDEYINSVVPATWNRSKRERAGKYYDEKKPPQGKGRKTIRRNKSKRSKKRGTLKKASRR